LALYITLLIVSFAIYMWTDLRKQIHMLQLNSYRNERYFDWMKDQKRVEASYLMFGLIISNLALNKMLTPNVYLLMHTTSFSGDENHPIKNIQEKKPLGFHLESPEAFANLYSVVCGDAAWTLLFIQSHRNL